MSISYPSIPQQFAAAADPGGVKSLVDIAVEACVRHRHRLGEQEQWELNFWGCAQWGVCCCKDCGVRCGIDKMGVDSVQCNG